jgi:hypothetical protein
MAVLFSKILRRFSKILSIKLRLKVEIILRKYNMIFNAKDAGANRKRKISASHSESFIEILKILQRIREFYFVTKYAPSSRIILTKLSHEFDEFLRN